MLLYVSLMFVAGRTESLDNREEEDEFCPKTTTVDLHLKNVERQSPRLDYIRQLPVPSTVHKLAARQLSASLERSR